MSTVVFIGVLVTFILGYKIYGGYLSKLLEINKDNPTPAIVKYDGSDFVPAKNWMILFGHHFASIAGAGPIVGPVLAYMSWGWLGTLLWIVLGTIFMGGIHDFLSLVISVREGGQTIGNISKEYISLRASKVFLGFLWFALVIVIAVFASLCAKSFISQP
ncbi:MAG: carbon starvation protein A, partial [Candidatus Omnitrophota bacterium]